LGDCLFAIDRSNLTWVLANPVITSAILGASRAEQLADSLAAFELYLPAQIKAKLDEISVEYRRGVFC
jgi:1-deoxyxylulose-5-phosphate synthase